MFRISVSICRSLRIFCYFFYVVVAAILPPSYFSAFKSRKYWLLVSALTHPKVEAPMPPKLTALGKWKQQKGLGHSDTLTFIVCDALHLSWKYLHKFQYRY
jgi:hypothetical protein